MVAQTVARVTDVSFTLDDGTGKVECRRWYVEMPPKAIVLRSLERMISLKGIVHLISASPHV